jgi:DNA-binding SARP family transcriptional activator
MTAAFLLNVLACLCWITWALFMLDVARCTVDTARRGLDAARWPHLPAAGPLHALAGMLIGTILLAVLGNRTAAGPTPAFSSAAGTPAHVVATAAAQPHPTPNGAVPVHPAAFHHQTPPAAGADTTTAARPVSVVVLAAHNGVHDSLWRIAARTLGDGARWPEIFQLNKGKSQPHGHTLTNPSVIFPGEELALPTDTTPTPPPPPPQNPLPPPPPAPTTSTPPTTPPPPSGPPSATPIPRPFRPPLDTNQSSSASPPPEPALDGGTELFVGLGLAAAVSAALVIARRRHRARYRPGSGDRDDLPVAPVVYQLRLAHLRADIDDASDFDIAADSPQPRPVPVRSSALTVGDRNTGPNQPPVLTPRLGVRDGGEVALDLAGAHGLGLVGAGAPAAARALVIAALTTTGQPATSTSAVLVIIPADDLATFLGSVATQADLPAALRVVADLDEALNFLEAETVARVTANPVRHTAVWPPLLVITQAPHHHERLQAVLDNGAPFGITGVLFGQWQPGITAYVRDDGTISAASPGQDLRGTRMFRLGEHHAAAVLDLLRRAQPHPSPPASGHAEPAPTIPAAASTPTDRTHISTPTTDTRLEVTANPATTTTDTRLEVTANPATTTTDTELAGAADPHPPPTTGSSPASTACPPGETHPPSPWADADLLRAAIAITVLGPTRVDWRAGPDADAQDITAVLQPRARELLVFLALHPAGVTREALIGALWPDTATGKATNAMNTALSRLRTALTHATNDTVGDIVVVGDGRYRLDPIRVAVDYWRFEAAVAARRAAVTEPARVAAYREIVGSYRGELADGLICEWIEPAREAVRRDAIDAVAALARALVERDPQQTLDLLETARAFDPHNELLYRDIMRLQQRLGQLDAIPRTLALLTTRLSEIDEQPSPHTADLAARLHQRPEPTPREHDRSAAAS